MLWSAWRSIRASCHWTGSAPEAESDVRLLERVGLNRPELRAWAMYDWANSAFQSTVITAVFPEFFASVAAADLPPAVATARYAWATTIAVAIIALLGPVLGAIADYRALKKKMLGAFMGLGVIGLGAAQLFQPRSQEGLRWPRRC